MKRIELEDYEIKLLVDCLDTLQHDLAGMTCNDLDIDELPINKKEFKKFRRKFHDLMVETAPGFIEHVKACCPNAKIIGPEYMGSYSIAAYFKEKFEEIKNRK